MEHTQGKLHLNTQYADIEIRGPEESGVLVAVMSPWGIAADGPNVQPGNARRLVACWNACKGVSTEWLEAQTDPASEELFGKVAPLDKRLQSAMQEIAALKAQRDELVALLTESQTSIGGDWRERRDALLAKHKGASHG